MEKVKPVPTVHKGPVEGMVIVSGRPQMECSDMPTISFDSIDALLKFCQSQEKTQKKPTK